MREQDIGQWREADAVFDRLLDLPEADRVAALALLPLDQAVRERVERLLASDQGTHTLSGSIPAAIARLGTPLAGRQMGRWMIESEIGRGGMSVVYRAHAVDAPDRSAALKLLTLGALAGLGAERFRREQSILARLNHPHIATLLDAGIADDGTPWIAMVLVEGIRIDQWCEQHTLDIRARVRLLLDVCAAVAHAHRSLVVHRDLKPSNVLVDGDGHVRLLDFGIARLIDDTQREATATHGRALSPMYAAPEQFTAAAQSTAIDVFGLGAVLYVLLAGKAPRPNGLQQAILAPSKAASDTALRGDLDAIVMKALADDPAARYVSVDALSGDLHRWLNGMSIVARRAPLLERLASVVRRHQLPIALAAAVVVSLVGGSLAALQQAHEARAQTEHAEQARAAALDSLERANALRDYLIGVFETQSPGKPRSELPSTAELLDEGERLAMASAAGSDAVRADMLDAITQVRLSRGDVTRASALIENSLALADGMQHGAAPVRARALMRRANVERIGRNFEAAMASLNAARSLLAGEAATPLATDIELACADALTEQRRFDEALLLLRPLVDMIDAQSPLASRQRVSIFGSMGIALAGSGRIQESLPFRERALEETRQRFGARHFRVALALNNVSVGNRQIGAFDVSEHQAREALAIYDEVLDAASEYRGSAHIGLGLLAMARGRFDYAVVEFDRGNSEIATARGIAQAEDYDFYHWNRGVALAQSGRREEATVALTRAEAALALRPESYALPAATAAAWLAILYCENGDVAKGEVLRARMHGAMASVQYIAAAESGTYIEADARCALAAGDAQLALRTLAPALESDHTLARGFAGDLARRRWIAHRVCTALGDAQAAAVHARFGAERLLDAGLDAHPLYPILNTAALGADQSPL